jgi:DNA-binding NtrC family response regulator
MRGTMKILIVDDERGARHTLKRMLRPLGEVNIVEAATIDEARAALAANDVDVVLIDLRLDADVRNRDGLTLVGEVHAQGRATPVVVSGSNDLAEVRAAMRLGAHDYVLKDELSEEMVLPILRSLASRRELEREVTVLRARRGSEAMSGLVGTSPAMQGLRDTLQRVSLSEKPVLVTGPTGSGKELAVKAIHGMGRHPEQPLLDLNCGAFPESLIDSLLFGHERGAFTGADKKHDGFFLAVRQGTLFLDEIAELPLQLQAKLLRVLETGTFRPIGSSQSLRFEGRVVVATHADLEERVARSQFRDDLLYRLNVLEVSVPSLEERREDIPALVAHFASRQPRLLQFTSDAVEELARAPWPGNIRQLRNLVDRIAVFAPDNLITREALASLPVSHRKKMSEPLPRLTELVRAVLDLPDPEKLRLVENALIDEAVRLSNGNKTAAARLLGVHRKVVERRLERFGEIQPEDAKPGRL